MSFISSLGEWLRKVHRSFTSAKLQNKDIVLARHNGDTVVLAISGEFYPITGGTIQGNSIEFTGSSPHIGTNTTDKYLRLYNTNFSGGASLYLIGKDMPGDYPVGHNQAGAFRLNAHNGTQYHSLIGYPDGRLEWNGVSVLYTHPTTSGNKHIPSGGSSGQILRWSADGTAVWGADQDTTYSLATQSSDGLMSKSDKIQVDKLNGCIDLSNSAPYVSSNDTSKYLRLFNTNFGGGGSVYLYGRDYSGVDAGTFHLIAHNGTTSRRLVGKPDGTLIWDGYNVLTDAVSYAKVADLPSQYTSINFSNTSVPNATFTNLGSFTPSKTGKWLVIVNVTIDNNVNGYRRLVIANSTTSNHPDRFRYIQTDGTTANSTVLQLSWLGNFTNISTVYFNVYQTSGVALNASGGYRAYYLGG